MANNKTFSLKLEEETQQILKYDIDNNVTRAVLDKLAREYDGMKPTDLFLKDMELQRVDDTIKVYERAIQDLKEYRVKLEEERDELEEVHAKESKALDDAWIKICKYGLTSEKNLDYTELDKIFKSNLMPDEDLTEYCTAKLKERKRGLEEVKKTSKSKDIDTELKRCAYLLKQLQRLEEVKSIEGGEL